MYNARGTLSKRSDTFFWSLGCVELLCFLSHLCAAPKSGFMLIIETWDGLRRSVTLRTECVQDESSYWTVGGFWNLEDQLDCALPIQNKQKCSFSLFHTCWQHCCTESTPSVCLNLKSIKLLQPTVTTAQDYHCIEHWAPSESYIEHWILHRAHWASFEFWILHSNNPPPCVNKSQQLRSINPWWIIIIIDDEENVIFVFPYIGDIMSCFIILI